MVNKLFQKVIHQMKDSIDKQFGIIDEYNRIIACSEMSRIGENLNVPVVASTETFVHDDYTLKPILQADNVQYTLFIKGNDFICNKYAYIIAVAFANIKNYYDEKYDRSRFIKDIILDNILPGDIYIKTREFCFDTDVARTVMVIRCNEQIDVSINEILQNIFPDRTKDFIININDNKVALVKETHNDISRKDLEELALSISETLAVEYFIHTTIGIGSTVYNVRNLARSFKEAQTALEIGMVFYNEKSIFSYTNLGIARLIYQLPTTLCESYLNEIFKRGSIDLIDEETLFTIQKFFENNLNVSEASRQLFIHRNTLLYRIEKIKKLTGLDLKEFDQAIAFKIALMVNKYLRSNPNRF